MKSRNNDLTIDLTHKSILEKLEDPKFWLPSPIKLTMENKTNIIYFLFRVTEVFLGSLETNALNVVLWQSWKRTEKTYERERLVKVLFDLHKILEVNQNKSEFITVLSMIKREAKGLDSSEKAAFVQKCLGLLNHDLTLLFLHQTMDRHSTWLSMANERYAFFIFKQSLDEKRRLASFSKRKESEAPSLSNPMTNSHHAVFIMLGDQKFEATDQEYVSAVRVWNLKKESGQFASHKMALNDLVGFIQRKRFKPESKALSDQSPLSAESDSIKESTTVSPQDCALMKHMVKSIQAEGVVSTNLLRIKRS